MKQERAGLAGYLVRSAVIFAAYFVTARFGLQLNAVSGFATLVWPPTGIALATIFLLGRHYWPSILLAAFAVNIATGAGPFVAFGIGAGNMLEAVIGASLLHRFRFDPRLGRIRDVLCLAGFAAILSTAVSATIGTTSLLFGGHVTAHTIWPTWLAWWVGDALGALVFAPLLLVWSKFDASVSFNRQRNLEAILYTVLLTGLCLVTFRGALAMGRPPSTFAFIIFPMLMWIAIRFGQIGSVSATFVMSVIAIWRTVAAFQSGGMYGSLSEHLLPLQSLIGVIAITFMGLAAVNAERERAQKLQLEFAVSNARLHEESSKLKALNAAKDEFIAVASHQLRTPATSVKQYIGMLIEGRAGNLEPSQNELAAKAYANNDRQLQIIGQLLRVARIDSGQLKLDKSRVNVVELVSDILAGGLTDSLKARDQSVTFTASKPKLYARIDVGKVRMVIENIIDNASKYSRPGQNIEVSLTANSPNPVITVRDHGVGIAERDLPKLFKKFSRIDNEMSTEAGGTGLGLYWAKKVVDLHGGKIEVTSTPNSGTTFKITLKK